LDIDGFLFGMKELKKISHFNVSYICALVFKDIFMKLFVAIYLLLRINKLKRIIGG
jgi:hypothetical protein